MNDKIKGHQERCQKEANQISKGEEEGEAGKEEAEIEGKKKRVAAEGKAPQ